MKEFFKARYILILGGLVFIVAGFIFLRGGNDTSYEFVLAEERDLFQEVNVTGRVEPVEEVDLSFSISGRVVSIPFRAGDQVALGQTLIQLDARDAGKDILDAEIALERELLDLDRIKRQSTNGLVARQSAEAELAKLYEEAFNLLSDLYEEVPSEIEDLESAFEADIGEDEGNIDYYRSVAKIYYPILFNTLDYEKSYFQNRNSFNQVFSEYQAISRNSPRSDLDLFLDKTYNTTQLASEFIKEARDITQLYSRALADKGITPVRVSDATTLSELSALSSLSSSLNEYLVLLSEKRKDIKDQTEEVTDTDLDLRNQELLVRQAENNLKSARDDYSDHFLKAPFGGIVTEVSREIGEYVTSNQNVVSMISLSLYEVEANIPEADIAKVKVGNIAQMTLDAFGRDTYFNAEVKSIDPSATILDGVATYKTTLVFTESYEDVKAGMTADIDILGEKISKVVAVPARAIIRRNGEQFVRILRNVNTEPVEVLVKTGFRGSDGYVEITDGLEIGDRVVTSL